MCGLSVIINNTNKALQSKFITALDHRGPDDNGVFFDDKICLLHNRLSILDLTQAGHQPMISEDNNYAIIFNGEIYNHLEIRETLLKKYHFKSTSDTETLLYGYIEYGNKIFQLINGIFSFVIYNKQTGNVIIARDPMGVKPLYYYLKDGHFMASSEIKSLTKDLNIDKELTPTIFQDYISLLYSPGETTPFNYIKKLRPGHIIELNVTKPSEIQITQYNRLFENKSTLNQGEKANEKLLEEHLFKAIERQMLSDVPIGFFLSGGLDSSTLVALAKAIYPDRKLDCFTTNLGEEKSIEGFRNDIHYARMVAKHLDVTLEEIKIGADILEDFDYMIYHLDEPISDPAALHTYYISKRARELGYKVLISGTGGDEVFSGYRRHQAIQMEKYYPYIPNSAIYTIQKSLSLLKADNLLRKRAEKLFKYSNASKYDRIISYFFWLETAKAKDLFSVDLKKSIEKHNPEKYFHDLLYQLPNEFDDLNRILYLEMNTYLPDNNLTYTDKMGMAAGVEIRVPFLDKALVEFSMQIPTELKMKGTTTKYLLKKVMEKYLPEEIINRPKTGFGAPVRKWIRNELVGKINSELSYTRINKRGIFDADKVWQLIKNNKAGKIEASYSIWALLAIESWMRQFVDE